MGGRDYARRVFALDLRSLAMMRIAVAFTVIVDLATRARHLSEHYSDAGVLTRDVARSVDGWSDASLLAISGSPVWAGLVFAAGFALAVAVLVGFRTRWTTTLLWLVVLSIQHRNPLVHDHRDVLFSLALCFGTLMPWGTRWSVDARDRPLAEARYTGWPAIAYIASIASIYLFAAILKSGPEWRTELTAVEHAIGLRYWANPAAEHLLDHPTVMSILTAAVLVFEAGIALLLISPWRPHVARWLVVAGIAALQLGFAIFLWLDTFPMISTALVLGLIPWRADAAVQLEPSRWRARMAAGLAGYLLALNVFSVAAPSALTIAAVPAELLGIEQSWTMFAPSPSRVDGWFVVAARTATGSIDGLTEQPVSWATPASFREGIRTTRELVYLRRLLAYEQARRGFASAHCAPDTISIAVYFVPVIAGERQPAELLVEHACNERVTAT